MTRIAVVDREYCKPNKCGLECIRFCPVNKSRRGTAIELSNDGRHVIIHEGTCIGCGICVRKCPFKAISIVNLPDELEKNIIHRYGENMFKLYNLPMIRPGKIMGIIGRNGSGKTTSVKILSGLLKPNLGRYNDPPEWDEIIKAFRGTEIQNYLKKLANGEIKAVVKTQYVELAKHILKGRVGELLKKADERGLYREIVEALELKHLSDRKIANLSGGELQKFLVAAVLLKDADSYFFDEPCSYLDIRERLRVARAIREFIDVSKKYVAVIEHDLMILDYISDQISVIFGEPGVYGIVSKPYGTRTGINNYLEGYLPAENMRIRREPIIFKITVSQQQQSTEEYPIVKWTDMTKKYESSGFILRIESGEIYPGEVLGVLGPNGIGKTTFVKILAGILRPNEGDVIVSVEKISVKPQELSPKIFPEETVAANLRRASPEAVNPASWIYAELIRKLGLNKMMERRVDELSGGELQKLAVAVALATPADLYLLDEPSAYLDIEERLAIAKVIRRIIEEKRKTALVVEHDLMLQNFVANRIMVFKGIPGKEGYTTSPLDVSAGFNELLKELDITVRRDPQTGRPRVNKPGSYLDRYQKNIEQYYLPEIVPEK